MKRALLIAGGTVGGLGAVLAITPPQLSSSGGINIAGGAALGIAGSTASASSSPSTKAVSTQTAATKTSKPVATKKATSKATSKVTTQATNKAVATASASATASATATATATPTHSATATPTHSATATPTHSATPTETATPTPTHTATATPTPAAVSKSGTFTGPAIFVNYGTVQVKITVTNGRITDAVAVQAPGGRNDRYTQMAVPILKQQTLTAQSANIKGASGASYTSYGWFKSLQGALANAGL
jgi:uncharacterized protein with FMN-binding domain